MPSRGLPAGGWRCDLHLHSGADPQDRIDYSTDALFATAAARGLQVVSLTLHNRWSYCDDLVDQATAHGLLLIPGIECTIEGRHVLVYNADADVESVDSFAALRAYKRPEMLVMAPHPFYPAHSCLREKLREHIDIFDAVEFCWFYHPRLNWNRMAETVADQHHLPLVGTSDSHKLDRVGRCYSTITGEYSVTGILDGVRGHRVDIHGRPLSLPHMGAATVARAVLYAGRAAWAWSGGRRDHASAA